MNLDDRLNEYEKKIDARLNDAEERIGKRLAGLDEDAPDEKTESKKASVSSLSSTKKDKAPSVKSDGRALGPLQLVGKFEKINLCVPRESEITQAMAFVQHSPRIEENEHYKQRAESTSFYYFDDDNDMNAWATDHPLKEGGITVEPPAIAFFGGLARVICLTSTALALQQKSRLHEGGDASSDLLKDAMFIIMHYVVSSRGLSAQDAERIYHSDPFRGVEKLMHADEDFLELAQTLRASMYMFVIGHELGHIAYGHTQGGKGLGYEISRHQEYDADSFALQTLTESPFSKYTFLGQAFITLIFAWGDAFRVQGPASTHPFAKDRFQALFRDSDSRSVKQIAKEFGLTKEILEDLLPPA